MKYIILLFIAGCVPAKITKPANAREAHIFKYTDLAVEAELNGKKDSVDYYLNLALKYDSVEAKNNP